MSAPKARPAHRPPSIRGALASGPTAYLLRAVLSRDELAERLDRRRVGEVARQLVMEWWEALDHEAQTWRRDREAQVREDGSSASGGDSLPQAEAVPPSAGMDTLTTTQAAERLGCTPRHVRDLAAEGKLPATRDGRDWRIPAGAVAEAAARGAS